jgi:protein transport protein SEC61 subunit gamma-like protein
MRGEEKTRTSTAPLITTAMADMEKITDAPVEFFRDGARFVQKCTKPTQKEYLQLIRAVGMGFIMMGVVGYVIKLIHIPIRYLIV